MFRQSANKNPPRILPILMVALLLAVTLAPTASAQRTVVPVGAVVAQSNYLYPLAPAPLDADGDYLSAPQEKWYIDRTFGLEPSLTTTPLIVGPDGPAFAYVDSNDNLVYAAFDGVGWQPTILGLVGGSPNLATDGTVMAATIINGANEFKFIFYDGTAWSLPETIASGIRGQSTSLSFVDGVAHVSYATIDDRIMHGRLDSSRQLEEVAKKSGAFTSIADIDGKPGIAIVGEDDMLYFASKTDLWDVVPVGASTRSDVSLASLGGAPGIAYDSGGKVALAMFLDGEWKLRPVADSLGAIPALRSHDTEIALAFIATTAGDTNGLTYGGKVFTSNLDGSQAKIRTFLPDATGPVGIATFENEMLASFISINNGRGGSYYQTAVVWPGTDINKADTDGDGQSDRDERICGSHPNYATSISADLDEDDQPNCIDEDMDGDGQLNNHETDSRCNTDPLDPLSLGLDTDGDNEPDCIDQDDDGDGQTDNDEIQCKSDPMDGANKAPDFDEDGMPDCVDFDDDNDGLSDYQEMNWNLERIALDGSTVLPTVLGADVGGELVVGYRDVQSRLRLLTHNGALWTPSDPLTPTSMQDFKIGDIGGELGVLYLTSGQDYDLVYMDSFDGIPTSTTLSNDVQGRGQDKPYALADLNGEPAVLYQERTSSNLYYRARDAGTWSAPAIVATDVLGGVSMATTDGMVWITYGTWTQDAGYKFFFRAHDGTAWTTPDEIIAVQPTTASMQVINGEPAIAYVDHASAFSGQLHFTQRVDGEWEFTELSDPDKVSSHRMSFTLVNEMPAIAYPSTPAALYLTFDGTQWNERRIAVTNPSLATDGVGPIAVGPTSPAGSIGLFTPGTDQFNPDTDGDLQKDGHEVDCGTDPLDPLDFIGDADGDGIDDCDDRDADDDGFINFFEDICQTDKLDATDKPADTDGDHWPDCVDDDDDNDGQVDTDEIACGSDPLDATSMSADTDGDGILDCLDPDDDNDLLLDDIEYGVVPFLFAGDAGDRPAIVGLPASLYVAYFTEDGKELHAADSASQNTISRSPIDTTSGSFHPSVRVAQDRGSPAFAYLDSATGYLKVTQWVNGGWLKQDVALSAEVFDLEALSHKLAVTYPDGGDIKVAQPGSTGWVVETVATAETSYAAIAGDADNPVIAYWDETTGDIMVATKDAGVWNPTDIHAAPGPAGDVAAQDNLGRLHVAWIEEGERVMMAIENGGGWTVKTVATVAGARDVQLTTLRDAIVLAYASDSGLHAATMAIEKTWFAELAAEQVGPGLGLTTFAGFAAVGYVDADGNPQIWQVLTDPLVGDTDGDGILDGSEIACDEDPLYAISYLTDSDKDGQADCSDEDDDNDGLADTLEVWTSQPVPGSYLASGSFDAALINGALTLAYAGERPTTSTGNIFGHDHLSSNGWVHGQQLNDFDPAAFSLAPGDTQRRAITYEALAPASAGSGVLKLQNLPGGATTIDDHQETGKFMDSAMVGGKLAVSYDQPHADPTIDITPLMYASLDGSTWTAEAIPDSLLPVGPTSLAALDGQPAIAYASGGGIYLAHRAGGTWTHSTVAEGNHALPSLALIDGTLAIVYSDLDAQELVYATQTATGWEIDDTLRFSLGGAVSANLADAGGQAVIGFSSFGHVWLLRQGEDRWTRDATLAVYASSESSLVVDGDKIHVAVRNTQLNQIEVFTSGTDPLNPDSDGDGQTDGDETTCGSDPLDAASLSKDLDRDGTVDCLDGHLAHEIDVSHRGAFGVLPGIGTSYMIIRTGTDVGSAIVTLHELDSTQEAKAGMPVDNYGFDLHVEGDDVLVQLTIPRILMPDKPWTLWHKVGDSLEEMEATFIERTVDADDVIVIFNTDQLDSFSPFTIGVGLPPAAAGGGGGGGSAPAPATGSGTCGTYDLVQGQDGTALVMAIDNATITLNGTGAVAGGWQLMNGSILEAAGNETAFGFCLNTSGLNATQRANVTLSIPALQAPAGPWELFQLSNGTRIAVPSTITTENGTLHVAFSVGHLDDGQFLLMQQAPPEPDPEPLQDPTPATGDKEDPSRAWLWILLVGIGSLWFILWRRRKKDEEEEL